MTPLHITVNLAANPWEDIPTETTEGTLDRVGLIPWGTTDGNPSVAMLITTPYGPVFAQTTYKLFAMAARIFATTATGELTAEEMGW
jgi:hypothetical protein